MIKCGFCSAPLTFSENVCVWDVDGADQCEDGRFGPPTYSLSIKCHACKKELMRHESVDSVYGEHEPEGFDAPPPSPEGQGFGEGGGR